MDCSSYTDLALTTGIIKTALIITILLVSVVTVTSVNVYDKRTQELLVLESFLSDEHHAMIINKKNLHAP